MPGLSGIQVLARVKRNHPDMPVIMPTAQCDPLFEQEARSFGAADFLTKPFSQPPLLGAVERLLHDRPRGKCRSTREPSGGTRSSARGRVMSALAASRPLPVRSGAAALFAAAGYVGPRANAS